MTKMPIKSLNSSPTFSIGVTTYKRIGLLKQTLTSLVNQDFNDFEILIGNDDVDNKITESDLGIVDSRIRILNYERNIGELENMNNLLQEAKGKYFAWIFDDDLCVSNYLSSVNEIIKEGNAPECVFTSYKYFYSKEMPNLNPIRCTRIKNISGKEFLKNYLSGKIRTICLAGFHETNYLKKLGGATRLSNNRMALYSEYLLIIQDGLAKNIVYIEAPFNFVRIHGHHWSADIKPDIFKEAGRNLLKESLTILSKPELMSDFKNNSLAIMNSCISVVVNQSINRTLKIDFTNINNFLDEILNDIQSLDTPIAFNYAKHNINKSGKNIPLYIIKSYLKRIFPARISVIFHFFQKHFSKLSNKPF